MRLRLNTLISLLVAVMLVLALGLALWLFNVQLQDTLEEGQAARVTNVAQSVAARDDVRQALVGMTMDFTADNPLQRDIDNLRQRLGVDFIVVMDRHALRLTHPEPARIGQAFAVTMKARRWPVKPTVRAPKAAAVPASAALLRCWTHRATCSARYRSV